MKKLGYRFKNQDYDFGGYTILQNKKICLTIDSGPSPDLKFSKDYQSGALSFEIISNGKKLISNCGYHQKNIKLNQSKYSFLTNESGGIYDDLIVTKVAQGFNIILNAHFSLYYVRFIIMQICNYQVIWEY